MKLLRSSFWLHSIFYTLLQRFSLLFFGTFAYFILVRHVSSQEFAVWALYLAIFTMFEMVKQGLLRNPTIRFLGLQEYSDKKNEVQSAALFINILVTAIAILVVVILNRQITAFLQTPALEPLLYWSIAFMALLIPFNHLEVIMQGNLKFQELFYSYFFRQGSFFGAILVLKLWFPAYLTIGMVVWLQIFSLALGTLILWKHSRSYLLQRFHFDAGILKAMLQFGKYIFGTNLFASISRSLDRFITANTLTDTVDRNNYVSYYDATGRVNMLIDVPSLAVADVLFPKNVEAAENEGVSRVKYYFERMCGIILSIVVPFSLFIFIFPKLIIFLLSGPEYYPAATVLQITILFCLVRPLSYQYGSTLDAIGKPAINFWSNLLMLLINLGASYYCLSRFGGIGAAYATVITYTLSFFIMYIVLRRHIGVELKNILRFMLQSYSDIFTFGRKLLQRKNGSGENPAGGTQ